MEIALIIVSACLALSEVLALLPNVKSNSIFELVVNVLKKAKDFLTTKPKDGPT